jgi:asparagine synthase (glutamine-hydrolysing)
VVFDLLDHRGPDRRGWLTADGDVVLRDRGRDEALYGRVILLHTRLSIIDLSAAGSQPMSSADERFHIGFNGEIYNYLELRAELERLGNVFRSHSDTEVLLEAWREWGPGALPRLVGMFAFAVLDREEQAVYLARDPFGIKPLYFAETEDSRVTFASEIPVLFALGGISRKANAQRLYDYLRFGVTDHGDETMFSDVRQLASGHYVRIPVDRPGPVKQIRYWSPPAGPALDISLDEAAERLRELFIENITLHLRSDVPIGVAFSGGIDSSANLTAMRSVAGPELDLHTFSYIASDEKLNEERWIDLVGGETDSVLHKVQPTASELVADLDDLIDAQGEPFGGTSIYAQYRVFRLAGEQRMKVMLDGQGADELFAGYHSYLPARFASLVRQLRLVRAARFLEAARRNPDAAGVAEQLFFGLSMLTPRAQAPLRRLLGHELLPDWLVGEWFRERGVHIASPWYAGGGRDVLRAQLVERLCVSSLPMLLRYEDRNSMRFSIESRVPFLTTKLAEFALSLPEDLIIGPDATRKRVLRRALRGLVPDAVLDRRDKIGFATPEQAWLGTLQPWVDAVFREAAQAAVAPIRLPAAVRRWQEVAGGKLPFDPQAWRLLNVIRWSERLGVEYA